MTTTTDITAGVRHDLFSAIKWEQRHGKKDKKSTVQGIQFPRRFVPKWNFDITWKHTSAGVLMAARYTPLSTEDLFNDAEVWGKYDSEAHRDFGRCLAFFVDKTMLPLACFNPHESNKLYLRTNQ
jgi:hypothetical protein